MFVCVFCERTFNMAPHSCPNCNDYKGLMTIEDAVAEYDWLDYLVAQPIPLPCDTPDSVGRAQNQAFVKLSYITIFPKTVIIIFCYCK